MTLLRNSFVCLVTALLLALPAAAGPVTPDQAARTARRVLPGASLRRGDTRAAPASPYYIFEGPAGGFALVAADDALPPLIAWSPRGDWPEGPLPENLRAWMEAWALRPSQGGLPPARGAVRGGTGKLLETANWNQTAPFNNACPVIGGQRALTGCSAVALGILMRYHRWPESGRGTHPAYNYYVNYPVNGQSVVGTAPAQSFERPYRWDNMPLDVTAATPASAVTEIATLLYDTAILALSWFGTAGTPGFTYCLPEALAEYMGYDAGMEEYHKSYYSDSQWLQMLYDNIDGCGPVLYSGQSAQEGHAFIIDGYDADGLLHINWGWGGHANGYFAFPNFDAYTREHAAILGARPDQGGTPAIHLYVDRISEGEGLTSPDSRFSAGQPFELNCRFLYNAASRDFSGRVAFARINREDRIEEIVSAEQTLTLPSNGYIGIRGNGTVTEINYGDRIGVVYRTGDGTPWAIAWGNQENGTVGLLPLIDSHSLAEATSYSFEKGTRRLRLKTKKYTSWTLSAPDGSVPAGGQADDGTITLETAALSKATYTLQLRCGDEQASVQFIMGDM